MTLLGLYRGHGPGYREFLKQKSICDIEGLNLRAYSDIKSSKKVEVLLFNHHLEWFIYVVVQAP